MVFKENTKTFKLASVMLWPLSKLYLIILEGQKTYSYTTSAGPSLNMHPLFFYLGSSSMTILDTEFHPVDASPLG